MDSAPMPKPKNPHAVALGRKKSARKAASSALNAKLGGPLGGRPPSYVRPSVWKRFQARAVADGQQPRDVLALLIERYADGSLE